MKVGPKPPERSPFHRGERAVQSRLGVRSQVEELGRRFIRDYLPEEHRAFYSMLTHLIVGTVDGAGRPWASIIVGKPGFIASPDPRTVTIGARRLHGDPSNRNYAPGAPVGVLGIEHHSRRRNRLTAKVKDVTDDALTLSVDQTFGNCPQYIQAREAELTSELADVGEKRPSVYFSSLNKRARKIIGNADSFYIATCFMEWADDASQGADVSHRGGKPGFVRIEDDRTLIFPDYAGNNHYNTVGNISLNPVAGLLFIDFDSGDVVYLTCIAEIVWDSEEKQAFTGAERLVRFTIDEGYLVQNALPMRWRFIDYSPALERTGSWEEVDARLEARREDPRCRELQVVLVERESSVISSFYLKPVSERPLECHKAGQFLPVEVLPESVAETVRRTYTISNAPNGQYYRLSIKREPAAREGLPPGLVSNHFHDTVRVGSIVRAYPPRGQFVLAKNSVRPVVLLSGGVGITPMISMLEQLCRESEGCGCSRPIWFFHGAISSCEHAFGDYVRGLAEKWPCLNVHFAYSSPQTSDVLGLDYDSEGFISIDLLKAMLPLDDYDYYFCGPVPFMKSIYSGLKSLNVNDERIHYEFFGPGTSLHEEEPQGLATATAERSDLEPVTVRFDRSGVVARWKESSGTLLELAESEGLNPLFSCRSGICGTCSTAVTGGDVRYVDPPLGGQEDCSALICCAYPAEGADELILDL